MWAVHKSLFVALLKLFESLISFGNPQLPLDALWLVSTISSNVSRLFTIPENRSLRIIGVCEEYYKSRRTPEHSHLRILSHMMTGGCTKFQTMVAFSHGVIPPEFTSIRRCLGAFINFSHHTKTSESDRTDCYSIQDIISLKPPIKPIWLPTTYFLKDGFGSRYLEDDEIAQILGLKHHWTPLYERQDAHLMIPVQMLDACLRPTLKSRPHPIVHQPRSPYTPIQLSTDQRMCVYVPTYDKILSPTWAQVMNNSDAVAKNDDAEAPISMWNEQILHFYPNARPEHLELMRDCIILKYRRRFKHEIISQFTSFSRSGGGSKNPRGLTVKRSILLLKEELKNILRSFVNASYMTWDNGSSIPFWRWSPKWKMFARRGIPPFIIDKLPCHKRPARRPNKEQHPIIWSKFRKFIQRGYLVFNKLEFTSSLIDYFFVTKGENDVRMVFNGTSSGLNGSVWAPIFWLPMSDSLLQITHFNSHYVDLDVGEMFLNFNLYESLQPVSSIDLTPFQEEIKLEFPHLITNQIQEKRFIGTWVRTWMGFRPSPETSILMYYLAKEIIRGNEQEVDNPLRWDEIVINSYGEESYDPSLPNVYKWNARAKQIAGDIRAYVDDLRAVGYSLEHTWQIARRIASILQFLGIQDAPRKRRLDHGPWAGSIYLPGEEVIMKTVSQKKWQKGRDYIMDLYDQVFNLKRERLDYKLLEQTRGYLCHLGMTYEILFPFLKGFHLTLASYLPKRDHEGWKLNDKQWLAYLVEQDDHSNSLLGTRLGQEDLKASPPKIINLVPRFCQDLKALYSFFKLESPPKVTVRPRRLALVLHGFADASKSGSGSILSHGLKTRYRTGIWSRDEEDQSSNYREFANLVETLEFDGREGLLSESVVYMATDNSTVENCLYKGNSSSPKLHDLIVRMRKAELEFGFRIFVTHVSGKRVIAQGTDGLSRGSLREGVSIGESMNTFCPWGKNVVERSPSIIEWVNNWVNSAEFLTPKQWYTRGHDHLSGYYDKWNIWRLKENHGLFIWTPPPSAADAAIEELRKAILKRHKSLHIVLIPSLFTHTWRKQMNKTYDLVLRIPAQFSFWPAENFEPFLLGICLPYLPCRPFQLRSTPKMLRLGRNMQSLFTTGHLDSKSVLRELLFEMQRLRTLPPSMVWSLLFYQKLDEFPYRSGSSRRKRKRKERDEVTSSVERKAPKSTRFQTRKEW